MAAVDNGKPDRKAWFTAFRSRLRAQRSRVTTPICGTVCISMVKNEQDIIEPFVRHNIRFFDAMIIMDNGSADSTRSILLDLARELDAIIVVDQPESQYDQSRFMSQALRYVQGSFFADAVCFLDADEFISASSRQIFDDTVRKIPVGSIGLMPWKTYLPDPDIAALDSFDPLVHMHVRRKVEKPNYSKAILRLGGMLDPDLTVRQGCHMVRGWNGKYLSQVHLPELPLLHFPIRSIDQTRTKGVVGWLANMARLGTGQKVKQGVQWKEIYDRDVDAKDRLSRHDIALQALGYAQEDMPADFWENAVREDHGLVYTRSYSDGRFGDSDTLIAAARNGRSTQAQTFKLPSPPSTDNLEPGIENAFGGAWHWNFLFLDIAPIQYVIELLQPKSILDIGCGNGAYPLLYRHLGVEVLMGVDGIDPAATVLTPEHYQQADLQLPFDSGKTFDLVVCLEVVEHLRPDATGIIVDSIERHAKEFILFSMAEPGQPGNGHINCKSMHEVLSMWAARGWQPDLLKTLAARSVSTMSWFRRNIVVLRKTGETGLSRNAEALIQIAKYRYRWYGQAPGIRYAAFKDEFPDLRSAYGLRIR